MEIAKKAVVGFFEEQNIPYKTHVADKLTCYKVCTHTHTHTHTHIREQLCVVRVCVRACMRAYMYVCVCVAGLKCGK